MKVLLLRDPDRRAIELPQYLRGADAQQQGVDVDQRGLHQVQGQHADLLALLVLAGEVAVLAVEQVVVGGVPVLHHL
ncbi:hypothetical protein [Streptomyces sp. RKAG293]|uniref:hypothetical protein n=1 Tax=Streptomyces sp. RKAG293 TaxID=2893403 RepID=UPI0020332C16|nr:hypothetical protein [Streptomyces sp. RKAG293]MCM2416602.1 hypothetical protein [Streptomyces sp. RKAG293]